MEREQQISKAKEVVRDLLKRYAKPHTRIHSDAAEDNLNRLRALEGLCGHCTNLQLQLRRRDGKNVVILGCSEEHLPAALYQKTPLGEKAYCSGYTKS